MHPNLAALPPRFLRTKEAAQFLSLSARTLEKRKREFRRTWSASTACYCVRLCC